MISSMKLFFNVLYFSFVALKLDVIQINATLHINRSESALTHIAALSLELMANQGV